MTSKIFDVATIILAMTLIVLATAGIAYAASIADNIQTGQNSNASGAMASAGGGGALATTSTGVLGEEGFVLTATPDKPTIKPGEAETIHIKAATSNGTGISDVNIQLLLQDFQTGKHKLLFAGQTDDKGVLDITTNIGPHAKSGQYFVIANAANSNNSSKSSVSTGFAVDDSGGSSSSVDSKGRCSGSSCH